MKKYCVFDLDGTLVDSMDEWAKKMLQILDESGINYPENIIQIITPLGDLGTAKLFREMGVSGTEEDIIKRMNSYAIKAYSTRIKTKPYIPEYLATLKNNGHVLAVLTASPHITTDVCLKNNGIYDFFEKIWSIDDFGLVKSDPEIYRQAADRLGADISEIALFDDNFTALSAAKSTGFYCIGVYDESSEKSADSIRNITDIYIKSFSELI